ncbi:hypothetical protein Adt_11873 [Abeliophyllum distichum]|uniref:Uncharacterized protein n=1 Tax=Abeliophyllum distichum TaxID=126358 RepID=A0ABD1UP68_9LAMI
MSTSSKATYLSFFFNKSCIDSGGLFERGILKALFHVPFIMATTTSDIWRSLMPRVAVLNLARNSCSDLSFSWTTCIRPMAIFLFLLLLKKYATKLQESSSNVLIDHGARVATQSLAFLLNVGGKDQHITASGAAYSLVGSTKSASDLRGLLFHRMLLSLVA